MNGAVGLALWSHWRRHRLQLITLLAGIALATALWSAVQAINSEARQSYADASAQLAAGQMDELHPRSGTIPLESYVALRRAGWQVTAVIQGNLRRAGRTVDILGVDLLSHPDLPAISEVSGTAGLAPVDVLLPPGRAFARTETIASLQGARDLPLLVETTSLPVGTLLMDIAVAEQLLGLQGQISRLLILPDQPRTLPALDQIVPDLDLISPASRGQLDRLTDSFHLNLSAFGLLSFAVGLFIVQGMVGLAFEQRRGMIRALRAMGVPLRRLTLLMTLEITLFALVGGVLGIAIGYFVAGLLLPGVAATLSGLYGAPVDGALVLRPGWVQSGLAMALGGTLLASSRAMWRLSRLPLLRSPGQVAWQRSGRAYRRQVAAGLGLIAAGCIGFWLIGGLIAGFVLQAGLLTGSALLLPPLLRAGIAMISKPARTPLAQWFWADMRAQLPGLSLALMALLLALAANVGVGAMVSSFRMTFVGWLDQRLASEIYVTARDDTQGSAIQAWLSPRADAVLPIRAIETRVQGQPVFLYGVVDHATYRDNWPLLAQTTDAWDRLATGTGALLNEQMARRLDLWPGQSVELLPGWSLPVLGVYSDYGNPTGQAIVALDHLLPRAPDLPNQRFGVRVAPDQAAKLTADLTQAFDLPRSAIVAQADLKSRSLAIFDKTFVVTNALSILTLGVAGFAIFTSLMTLWSSRIPQLAPLWALGLTRRKLAGFEILRSLLLALFTMVLALPLGVLLGWVLLAVVNVEAFGWRLPLLLFPGDWLKLGLLALVTAALAALLPARKLYRLPPSDLLRVFANER